MSRRLTFLFAVAAGVALSNLDWTQPLLEFIAADLGARIVGVVGSGTQTGILASRTISGLFWASS